MPFMTLRPTNHEITEATVLNPANAYDGNIGTYANIEENVVGDSAELALNELANDPEPATRTLVEVNIVGSWQHTDVNDHFHVVARKDMIDPWTIISDTKPGGYFPLFTGGTRLQTKDVTALMGSEPSFSWRFGMQFFNTDFNDPPNEPPNYTDGAGPDGPPPPPPPPGD